jgi:hypothetical protein
MSTKNTNPAGFKIGDSVTLRPDAAKYTPEAECSGTVEDVRGEHIRVCGGFLWHSSWWIAANRAGQPIHGPIEQPLMPIAPNASGGPWVRGINAQGDTVWV